jgi:hypothetical protein
MTDPDAFTLTRTNTPFLEDYVDCKVGPDGAPVVLGSASVRP